jgi:phenylalanine-4-hydroxylase
LRDFTPAEHDTWRALFARLAHCRAHLAHPSFNDGLARLAITGERIPSLDAVNDRLMALTGWRGVPVTGLEDAKSFFTLLARREFPIGAFIRDAKDLSYTPAPDVFHDMYGHLPLFADPDYADFNQRIGQLAARFVDDPLQLRRFERFYWFSLEFPLIETTRGRRIFGGGILSSFGESAYALSSEPEVLPFDLAVIRDQEYRIDIMQPRLFVLDRPETLYSSLPAFERHLS